VNWLGVILKEPPLRRLVKQIVRVLPVHIATKALWDAVERPQYLCGVLHAAEQAQREGYPAVSVVEFGVAEGYGLLALQNHAEAVERATGIQVSVYGFDSGAGLPAFIGDYRDHPDHWRPGDYPMNETGLRERLTPRTRLILGDVTTTVLGDALPSRMDVTRPIGFVAMDLDLYYSTVSALRILTTAPLLRRVAMYFDDLNEAYNHRFAGELLAIDDFNAGSKDVKIDRWRGLESWRPFPEAPWLRSMYLAHNLAAISRATLDRPVAKMR